jgi:hypothetical protein
MIDISQFSTLETVLFLSAVIVALGLLRPYMPPWAVFAFSEMFAIYWFARILTDGPNTSRVALLAMGVAGSIHTWWRYLRGREWYKNL